MPAPPTQQAPAETGAAALTVARAEERPGQADEVLLNPFGELTIALAWAALVAINLWTWRTILRRRPGPRPAAGPPEA